MNDKSIGVISSCQYNTTTTKLRLMVFTTDYGSKSVFLYTYVSNNPVLIRLSSDPGYIKWLFDNSHLLMSLSEYRDYWYNESDKKSMTIGVNSNTNRLYEEFRYKLEKIREKTILAVIG